MPKKVNCFIAGGDFHDVNQTIAGLKDSPLVLNIYVLNRVHNQWDGFPEGVEIIDTERMHSTSALKKIEKFATTEYTLLYFKPMALNPGPWAVERMVQAASDTRAGIVYSDFYVMKEGQLQPNPVIDYQDGSLRDDFNFGSVLLFRTDALRNALQKTDEEFSYAGMFDIRLKISQNFRIVRVPEYLYTEVETDTRKSGEKQFDYVDPRNRIVQIEMEKACTRHLKDIGAWLKPEFKTIDLSAGEFPVEVSVIIPVRNRAKTLEDAIRSVFSQKASFGFNLIVVDNHSTDGTTEIINWLAGDDNRLVHIIPGRHDLRIGGCWTTAVMDSRCGRFAVQLDSDDLYINDQVLQKVVDTFYSESCAMVVGSYQMVNFKLEEIPPGLIDHKEWTPENGRNNALRINGLGAPRAFFTPVLREIRIPNTSYGEDYAVGLRISREYQIGRIYEPLYLCRRWEDNSDVALDVVKTNNHNLYKDRLRTMELWARMDRNKIG
jgi:hypothetical protein